MAHKTKKELGITLKKLMQTKPFDKISVIDIVNECNYNRQTFYYHFQDKYELLGWIYKNEALTQLNEYKKFDNWQEDFLKIFSYVKYNRKFCMNTLKSLGRDHFDDFLFHITYDILMEVVNEVAKDYNIAEKDCQFIAEFYSFAFAGILTHWMQQGMKENAKDIIDNLNKLVEGTMKKAIAKY